MGIFARIFGTRQPNPTAPTRHIDAAASSQVRVVDPDQEGVEIDIVGESYRQDAIEAIAGPKGRDGKRVPVALTFRCEPDNEHDPNAVRVEVLGRLVGYVPSDAAIVMSSALKRQSGGSLQGHGLIVGGWRDGSDEGSFGVRGWITRDDAQRLDLLGIAFGRPERTASFESYPTVAEPGADEIRLTPDFEKLQIPTQVTVTREEHYQPTIEASRPAGRTANYWPVVVDLDLAPDPHAKADAPMVRVRIGAEDVGFFTRAMTERHRATISSVVDQGKRATAVATARLETKSNTLQLTVELSMPTDTPVVLIPLRIVNVRTGTSHWMGEELPDGTWKARCGATVSAADVRILCYSKPSGLVIDQATGRVATSHYTACGRC